MENTLGAGHPTLHPDGRHLLTDCYLNEPMTWDGGTIPLRWIDVQSGEEECLARIRTKIESRIAALRVAPHPAWTRDWKHIASNAAPDGTRRIVIADLRSKLP